jgi:hypothetical protein
VFLPRECAASPPIADYFQLKTPETHPQQLCLFGGTSISLRKKRKYRAMGDGLFEAIFNQKCILEDLLDAGRCMGRAG